MYCEFVLTFIKDIKGSVLGKILFIIIGKYNAYATSIILSKI